MDDGFCDLGSLFAIKLRLICAKKHKNKSMVDGWMSRVEPTALSVSVDVRRRLLLPVSPNQITGGRYLRESLSGELLFSKVFPKSVEVASCGFAFQSMALMACQAQRATALSLNRSTTGRRIASPPSAFFSTEVHASYSSSSLRALTAASSAPLQRRQRKPALVVCGLFGLGAPELVVIAGVAALLFGPKQLPQLGKKLGQSVKSFQEATKEFEAEVRGEADEASEEKETITPTPVATPSNAENTSSS